MPVVVLHQGLPERSRFSIAELVEAIGTDEFGTCLIRYLNDVCGADHFAIFQLGSDSMSALTFNSFDRSRHVAPMVERYIGDGLWREDPVSASRGPTSIPLSRASSVLTLMTRVTLISARASIRWCAIAWWSAAGARASTSV